MPRKHLRSVASSWTTEDDTKSSGDDTIQLGTDISEGDFDGYDPDAFYLRASDYQGRCITITITIPATFGSAMHQLIESQHTPYKTKVEVARDLMVHGLVARLRELGRRGYDIDTNWFIETLLDHSLAEAERHQAYTEKLQKSLELHYQHENWGALTTVIYDAKNMPLPAALKRERDAIVAKYEARIPAGYHPTYEVGGPAT